MKNQLAYQYRNIKKPIFSQSARLSKLQTEIDYLNHQLKYSQTGHFQCDLEIKKLEQIVYKLNLALEKIIAEKQTYEKKLSQSQQKQKQMNPIKYKIQNQYALIQELKRQNAELKKQINKTSPIPAVKQPQDLRLANKKTEEIKKLKNQIEEYEIKLSNQRNAPRLDPKAIQEAQLENESLRTQVRNYKFNLDKKLINFDDQHTIQRKKNLQLIQEIKNKHALIYSLEQKLQLYQAGEYQYGKKVQLLRFKLNELINSKPKRNPAHIIVLEEKYKNLLNQCSLMEKLLKEHRQAQQNKGPHQQDKKLKNSQSIKSKVLLARVEQKQQLLQQIVQGEKNKIPNKQMIKEVIAKKEEPPIVVNSAPPQNKAEEKKKNWYDIFF